MYISRRVQTTAAPTISDLSALAERLQAAGQDIITLGQGLADFPPPVAALDAARRALAAPETQVYSPDQGLLRLREAIARKWQRDAGVTLDPEQEILVTAGGNQAAVLALLVATDLGDEVILPTPYYFNQQMAVHLAGLRTVEAPLAAEDGFQLTWERIAPYITRRTRAVLFCTPSNPTGAVADPAALRRLAGELVARRITIIVDETYEYYVYPPAQHTSLIADPALRPHVLTLSSFSKCFGMAGWRVGYVVAPPVVITEALKVQDTLVICAPVISQLAVSAALDSDYYPALAAQRAELIARRAALQAGVAAIPALAWPPAYGSIFAFVRVQAGPPVDVLAEALIREAGVLTLPGTIFGAAGAGHLRLSYGAAPIPVLNAALERMRAYFAG